MSTFIDTDGKRRSVGVGFPMPTGNRIAGSIVTSQVAVATAATQVAAVRASRQSITLTSPTAFWIGPAGVTSANGYPVPANAVITVSATSAVFAVGAAALTVSVLETF